MPLKNEFLFSGAKRTQFTRSQDSYWSRALKIFKSKSCLEINGEKAMLQLFLMEKLVSKIRNPYRLI